MNRWSRPAALALALAGIGVWTGCGGSDVDLEELQERVAEAQARVDEARAAVEAQQAVVNEANTELDGRRAELAEAEAELANASGTLASTVDDPLIFRGVQSMLLDDRRFEDLAIRVSVIDGIVTLEGEIPDADVGQAAVDAARSHPGVVTVHSRLIVREPEPEPEAD